MPNAWLSDCRSEDGVVKGSASDLVERTGELALELRANFPEKALWCDARASLALPEAEICDAFESVGFKNVHVTHRFDPFGGTAKERTARKYGVIGVNVAATKS